MKIVNIKKSLLEMDKATDCKYDLTTLYESCNLDEKKKKELVKYVDAFDIDATNRFLSNEASNQGLMEEVADDLTDEEVSKMLGESDEMHMKTNSKTLCESVIHMTDETHANPLVTGQTLEVGDLVYDDNGNKLKVISVEENSKYSRNISFVNVDTNETSSEIVGNNTYWEKVVDGDTAYEVDDDIQIEFHPIDELTTQLEALEDEEIEEAVPAAVMALASSAATGFGQAVGDKLTSKILGEDLDNTSIEKEVRDAMYAFLEPKYDTEFVNDYCGVQVEDTEDNVIVRVNAELGYEGLSSLGDYLNKTIIKYDPQTYFEPETTGRLVAYIRKDQSDDDIDETIVNDFKQKVEAANTQDEVLDIYSELQDMMDLISGGTLHAVHEIILNKFKQVKVEKEENEIDFDSEVTFNESINEGISESEIASVLRDARDTATDFGITDEFTNEYYISSSVSAFGYPLDKLFMFLPDHLSEEDKEYQDAIRGWKENEQACGDIPINESLNESISGNELHKAPLGTKIIDANGRIYVKGQHELPWKSGDDRYSSRYLANTSKLNIRYLEDSSDNSITEDINNIEKVVSKYDDAFYNEDEKIIDCASEKTCKAIAKELNIGPENTSNSPVAHIIYLDNGDNKITEAIDTNWDEEVSNCKTLEDIKSLLKKIAVNYECGNITEEKVYQLYNSLDDKLNDIDTPVHYVADLLDEVESEINESLSDDDLDYYFTDDNIEYIDDDFTDDELASILGGDRNYCPECGSNMYSDGHCYKCGDPEEIDESLNEDALDDHGVSKTNVNIIAKQAPNSKFYLDRNRYVLGKDLPDYFNDNEVIEYSQYEDSDGMRVTNAYMMLNRLNEDNEPEKYIKLDLMEPDYNYFTIGGKEVPYRSHEEAKEHLDDFKFSDYEKELYEFLKSNNMYNEIYVQPDNTLCIKVEYGDWKHDHAYLDKLVHNFFFNKGLILESEKEVTEESDSDCFSADHFYRIVDVVFSMSLKPVNEDINDADEVLNFKRDVESADNADDIQDLIYSLSDGVAEDNCQTAFYENEDKDLQTLKDAVISALDIYLEDNEWLGESKSIKESYYKKGDRVVLNNGMTGTVTKDFDWENEDQVSVKIDGTGEMRYPRSETLKDLNESLNEELWNSSRVNELVTHYLDQSNVPVNTLAQMIMKQMKEEGSKLPFNTTDFYDALYMAVDRYNSNDHLNESNNTHQVYFTQDGIDQVEFEGTEDECNKYISDIQSEQDDEFGDEAPERFVRRINESINKGE